jgi:hypothetical protein
VRANAPLRFALPPLALVCWQIADFVGSAT